MSIALHSHVLPTRHGLPLRVDLRFPQDGSPRAGVIVCHGFKGFKDWGFFPWVSERLAEAGFAVATPDFSHNGVGDTPGEFTRLDLFEQNTYSQELSDLGQVMGWLVMDSPVSGPLDGGRLGVLGHSRGALAGVVAAAENPDIRALVTWNGVSRALRYSDRQLAQWERDGRLEFENSRTGQQMAVGWGLVQDARAHARRFDLVAACKRMRAAHLIVHAAEDLAVPVESAEELRAGRADAGRCRVEILERTGHTLGAAHPFQGPTPALERATALARDWFNQHLGPAR
jgi:dienelactone hydrolase